MASAKKKRRRKRRIRIQIILIILVLLGLAYYYLGGYAEEISQIKEEATRYVNGSNTDTFKTDQTTTIVDINGKELASMNAGDESYYLTYEEIPQVFEQAIISIEDKKFYSHNGVDYKAILRAIIAAVRRGEVTQGGSTITQQLAKNIFLTQDRNWERKVEEIFIAIKLEEKYSKQQIMEYYLNNIYFANRLYGIQAASRGYFNRDAKYLTLSEVAFLCAIPNNPSLYDPLTNMDATLERRDLILQNMYEDGKISASEYKSAIAEEIVLDVPEDETNDYEETYITNCAIRALMAADGFEFEVAFDSDEEEDKYDIAYAEEYAKCQEDLLTGGYTVYTSIDPKIQKQLQKAVNQELKSFKAKNDEGIYKLQGAAVCINNATGYVSAIVGGRSQQHDGYTLNRAYQSFRQPGSSIKPLLVYTPCLELGYTPDTIVEDKKIEDGPKNSSGTYSGKITLRTAVAQSKNTVAWQLFEELTPVIGFQYLLDMNYSHIEDDDYRLASALGGFTTGVSALEMAAGYATLENDGVYRAPTCVMEIVDSEGNQVEFERETKQIYKKNASRMMTSMLETVMQSGTGQGLALEDMSCAGKTGTTNENKDGWFVGYTPYYTTSVWVGYDLPKELTDLQGSSYPGKIWNTFMEKIHENLENQEFASYTKELSNEEETQ
ncbi:transglycosylase domain-containing protein [Eubacterium oxidoreducens]|uniref:Penicillin-binding protein 1A n=1 Tax=Eubacterium oxidoreducens TaxID=1732 RepID=A0A1G6C6W8_EUBOX|nr:PBP1A family penicillin-binding protein [Eubacterium oxidoreducens]SDB28643.1 penicillin-binding protein, 1A family [Eubacterium oxidoreducens]